MGKDYKEFRKVLDCIGDLCELAEGNEDILDILDELEDEVYNENKVNALAIVDRLEAAFNDLFSTTIEDFGEHRSDLEAVDGVILEIREYIEEFN